jgi:hypothetical protein
MPYAAEEIEEVFREESELRLRPYLVSGSEKNTKPMMLRCPISDLLPPTVLAQLHRMVN